MRADRLAVSSGRAPYEHARTMEPRSLSLLRLGGALQARSSCGTVTLDPLWEVSSPATDSSGVGAKETTLTLFSGASSPGEICDSAGVSCSGKASSFTRSNSPARPRSRSHRRPRWRSRSSRAPWTCSTRTEFGRLQSNTNPATVKPRRARSFCFRYSYSTAADRSAIASTSASSSTMPQGTAHLPSATSRSVVDTAARAWSLCARASS
mmetsp:Transcript_21391/g.51903  ORF Transcript_21391/g.51903 Transcript_21391/m.51903 type:complete len:209 (-) Transcript_21391:487-1113(-)